MRQCHCDRHLAGVIKILGEFTATSKNGGRDAGSCSPVMVYKVKTRRVKSGDEINKEKEKKEIERRNKSEKERVETADG